MIFEKCQKSVFFTIFQFKYWIEYCVLREWLTMKIPFWICWLTNLNVLVNMTCVDHMIFIVEVFFITWIYEIRERMWQYQHDERYGEWYDSFLRSQTEWNNLKPILCQLMSVYHRISQHDEENFLNWNYQSIYILLTVILTCSKTNFYDL